MFMIHGHFPLVTFFPSCHDICAIMAGETGYIGCRNLSLIQVSCYDTVFTKILSSFVLYNEWMSCILYLDV